jgi:hypothetical protein
LQTSPPKFNFWRSLRSTLKNPTSIIPDDELVFEAIEREILKDARLFIKQINLQLNKKR